MTLKEWTFGTHYARWEDPDLLICTFRGPAGLEDAQRVIQLCQELAVDRPIFVISDVSESTIDKPARDYFSEHIRTQWFRALVYVGADVVKRAATKAIVIALYFTGRSNVTIEFADTQDAARRLIDGMRRGWEKAEPVRHGEEATPEGRASAQ